MKKKLCLISILSFFPIFFSTSSVYADSISPFKNVVDISISDSSLETIFFTNEDNIEKEILLEVYGYDTETEQISEDVPTLLRVDTDTFNIEHGSTKELQYEVVIPENTEPGTYFNILLLSPYSDNISSVVNTSHSVSQIVEINVFEKENTEMTLPENPGSIAMEVVEKGIPYIKSAVVKYSYTNTSNYILQPEGELQVFNEEQKKEPIYIQINEDENLLYPGDTLTETFTLDAYIWSLDDLISNRVVLGRFYNGLDGKYQGEQLTIQSFKDELLISGVVVLLAFVILGEASKKKGSKSSKYYDEDSEDEEE